MSLEELRKQVRELESFKGKHTELISLYIPPGTDRSVVMQQLTNELSQSSNIKSPITRKNVQAALRKIVGFIRQIDFKIPKTGLVIFSGNTSESEGKVDIQLFSITPPKKLNVKTYWCDSVFYLEPLKEMLRPVDVYGLVVIDKKEATLGLLKGKRVEKLLKITSLVPGKIRAGGQSARRFDRLREEAELNFYQKVAEKAKAYFVPIMDELRGIILGGPGFTKEEFFEHGDLDYRIKQKIIGKLDTSYSDESGLRELVERSSDMLKETAIMKEKEILREFFSGIPKKRVVFGLKATEKALREGRVSVLILSEKVTDKKIKHEKKEIKLLDYLQDLANTTSTRLEVVSRETEEGIQFFNAFEGVGGILRF